MNEKKSKKKNNIYRFLLNEISLYCIFKKYIFLSECFILRVNIFFQKVNTIVILP